MAKTILIILLLVAMFVNESGAWANFFIAGAFAMSVVLGMEISNKEKW
jgi:hypothetical protein